MLSLAVTLHPLLRSKLKETTIRGESTPSSVKWDRFPQSLTWSLRTVETRFPLQAAPLQRTKANANSQHVHTLLCSAKTTYTNGPGFTQRRPVVAAAQGVARSATPTSVPSLSGFASGDTRNLEGTQEVNLELVFGFGLVV